MPRTKEQFEEMRRATADKIQAAAGRLFAKKGLAGTSVQDIADEAGISVGLVYRHYKSKEALFGEMVGFALEGLDNLTGLFRSGAEPKPLLEQVTREIYEDFSRDDEFSNIMIFMTQAYLSGEGGPAVEELIKKNLALLDATAELIRRGQAAGDFKAGDARQMAVLYFSAIQGMSVFQAAWGGSFTPPSAGLILSTLC